MTQPIDPNDPGRSYPPRPATPAPPPQQPHTTGPYNRPQPPPGQPGGAPRPPAQAPGPRPPGPPNWGPGRPERPLVPPSKGFLGALLDINFDHMVTAKLIKLIYLLALIAISLVAVIIGWYGLAFLKWNTTLGVMTLMFTPIFWLFEVLVTRMVLEFLINQFKISEYLRILKDRGEIGR